MTDPWPWQPALDAGRLVIALVRHGQTAWNAERRFLGCSDVPLDAVGRAQIEALGRAMPPVFSRVYSSPLQRAHDTARALHPEPELVPELAELAQGELEGLCRDEAVARFPDFFERWTRDSVATAVPGGESLLDCHDRALPAFRTIVRAHRPGELVAVVTHQLVIASITCATTGVGLHCWRDHGIPNATMTLLSWDGEGFELLTRAWSPASLP